MYKYATLAFMWRALFTALLPTLAACTSDVSTEGPVSAEVSISAPGQNELIFSSVKSASSEARHIAFRNSGQGPLELRTLAVTGLDAAAFKLSVPALPLVIGAGEAARASVTFLPTAAGTHAASLQVGSSAPAAVSVGLYGLGSEGEQGENEPPLQAVVDTLGDTVDVGGDTLELGSSEDTIGDEVLVPLFEKAVAGPVTLKVVARYGPEEVFPYGFYTLGGAEPALNEVGRIAAEYAQELLPPVAAGGVTFDPGTVVFGVYGQASGETQSSLDNLNSGDITHALRVYPLKNRRGNLVADSYLIGLEEARNGDYQDALFVLSNVKPSRVAVPDVGD
ncbi:MAG: hypothetical protein AVDCRST_MAG86-3103 [uncultured Truepera sp.]|uniref:Abnormal spindle-like microcephaly-associated protein ASH domain-containing protein n=1 Tax=uncultured Truepera sp. TaxID=543023 RepID=A0A6J4VRN8_9DEIN|nr:MAG: hypothetical protein AVDCRST_MAG86-3103 [uncultured Truepera sp.]